MERIIIMTHQPRIDIYDLPEPILNRTLLLQLEQN
jgi:hypothetical protein